jgi:hypothetical protein
MKHRGEGTFIQTKNIGNNNRSRERVQYDNRSVNQLNQNHFNNRYGERVQYDNRSVNQLNQNHFNMAFQQSGTTAYPPSNISSGNHNSNHLHFENNSDQIKVITKLPNSEQSYKGKVQTHNYINRQNQSTTGKL